MGGKVSTPEIEPLTICEGDVTIKAQAVGGRFFIPPPRNAVNRVAIVVYKFVKYLFPFEYKSSAKVGGVGCCSHEPRFWNKFLYTW